MAESQIFLDFLSQFGGSKQQVKAHAGMSFTIRSHLGSPSALGKTSALIEISEQGEKIVQSRGKRSLAFFPTVVVVYVEHTRSKYK